MPYRRFEPRRPYALRDVRTGDVVSALTGAQLNDLLDLLVREHNEDRAYWFDAAVLEWLSNHDADGALVERLRLHIDAHGPCELAWSEA